MPMISGRMYCTLAALCSPKAPAMSRSKQAMQKPMFFGFPAAVRIRAATPTTTPVSRISQLSRSQRFSFILTSLLLVFPYRMAIYTESR